jgi:cell surface protein SprA
VGTTQADTANSYNETGNFSMTYFSAATIFKNSTGNETTSPLFEAYLTDRTIISQRQAALNHNSAGASAANPGFQDGFSPLSQNVVVPAFLAAYSGQNPNKITLNPFPIIPFPNWTMSYNAYKPISALIPWVKKNISSINFSNAYTGTYSVAGYNYNLLFNPDDNSIRDLNGDFLPRDQIPAVAISDAFSPLIKIAIAFKNGVTPDIEVRTERQATLSMSDLTVTEVHGSEYIVGAAYKIKNVLFPIKIGQKAIRNDITLRADLSIRQNETFVRNSIDLSNQVTGGQQIISIKTQAEYNINTRVTFRLFFDKVINNPFISSTFPTSTMDGGIAIRFSLS